MAAATIAVVRGGTEIRPAISSRLAGPPASASNNPISFAANRNFAVAAMSASNWNPLLKRFHDRLAATGKLPKVVIVAVMRKMITTLNAMVRDDVVWADRHRGRHTVPTTR